jgi:hypothetical protein
MQVIRRLKAVDGIVLAAGNRHATIARWRFAARCGREGAAEAYGRELVRFD